MVQGFKWFNVSKGSRIQLVQVKGQGFKSFNGSNGSKFHMVDYIVSNKFIFDATCQLYVLIFDMFKLFIRLSLC